MCLEKEDAIPGLTVRGRCGAGHPLGTQEKRGRGETSFGFKWSQQLPSKAAVAPELPCPESVSCLIKAHMSRLKVHPRLGVSSFVLLSWLHPWTESPL